jgi:hypothetical protein
MPQGMSLHIAVNNPDPMYYGPHVEPLKACINDADKMADLAAYSNFVKIEKLIDDHATLGNVLTQIEQYAHDASAGDLVFISYSGHGSQIPVLDKNNSEEDDKMDETLCLYDTQLIDTEFYHALAKFKKDVRIFILLDSCHSGTAIHEWIHESWDFLKGFLEQKKLRFRYVSDALRKKLYKKHQLEYKNRQQALLNLEPQKISATVCLISACQDNQRAIEDLYNGRFTSAILFEANERHSYQSLHKRIHKHLHAFQSPNLFTLGRKTNNMLKQPFLKI